MAKDVEEVRPKKRGKAESPPSKNAKKPALDPLAVYEKNITHEENEAAKRSPEDDLKLYREICGAFAQNIMEILALKTKKPKGWEAEIKEKRIETSLLTTQMKKLNRMEKMRMKVDREHLTKAKLRVDASQLKLYNLLCEKIHLKKEVDKCLHFKSKDLGIDLVPVKQFFKEAPPDISRHEVTESDEHQLQLARLEWELIQRKEKALLCQKLQGTQQTVAYEINKKKTDLDNMFPMVKSMLAASKPIQEQLALPGAKSFGQGIVTLLPDPLYFLFVQCSAFSEARKEKMKVDVKGDEDEAKVMGQYGIEMSSNEDSDSDGPEDDKRRHRKRKIIKKEEKQRELLKKHPLWVEIGLEIDASTSVLLKFYYLVNLQIVTLVPSLELKEQISSPSTSQLLASGSLFSGLFPGDVGSDSPNKANHFQLEEAGIDKFDSGALGLPYLWVQRLGGLDFVGKNGKITPDEEISRSSIPTVVKFIKKRVKARVALASQIVALEKGIVTGLEKMKAVKLSSELKSWQTITYADYAKYDTSNAESFSNPNSDLFCKAIAQRGQAKLTMLIVLRAGYPHHAPLFSLQLDWNGATSTASTNEHLRDIEREVNLFWKELIPQGMGFSLLTKQVYRAMVCFDIMLECQAPKEFNNEKKTFFHPFRGRTRSHPYKFVQIGEGLFTQR